MPVTFSWFSNTNPFNPNSPASYNKISGTPTCIGGATKVCAIYTQVDVNNKPIINEALDNEITTTLDAQVNSVNVKLKN